MNSALVWFRRDLRDYDHAAFYAALTAARQVYCVFVFDTTILNDLPQTDRRIDFIHASVAELQESLRRKGGNLLVVQGDPVVEIPDLAKALGVQSVFANRDYEPAALTRDRNAAERLAESGIRFALTKDQVIFDGDEVLTQSGTPYTVFTPYKNNWLKRLSSPGGDFFLKAYPVDQYLNRLVQAKPEIAKRYPLPSLSTLGFTPSNLAELRIASGMSGAAQLWADFQTRISDYKIARDFPAIRGVSYLSFHLRFGTVSIRELAAFAFRKNGEGATTWLSELCWRDFYFMILQHFPRVEHACFKPEFDALQWEKWPEGLLAWQEGRTGYPMVDAAMRQLAHSGFMHNRLRMIAAAFLTKDLGISWQAGEAWFALHLNDFDLAANNGGWQWSASTGCDAQPWFRIFNPVTQSEKFDPQGKFIRRYVPELAGVPDKFIHAPWTMSSQQQAASGVIIGRDYPLPIVDHALARKATLARFEQVKSGA
ncbi:MAG: deoxyribodipyrimidine photo-lyase [Pseudomonadota bacterium]